MRLLLPENYREKLCIFFTNFTQCKKKLKNKWNIIFEYLVIFFSPEKGKISDFFVEVNLSGHTLSLISHLSFKYKSFYKSACLSVSDWVCLFVCSLTSPKRWTPARDDFPWDKEGFRLKNIWIRRTVSWKLACILAPHSTLAVNIILSSMNL